MNRAMVRIITIIPYPNCNYSTSYRSFRWRMVPFNRSLSCHLCRIFCVTSIRDFKRKPKMRQSFLFICALRLFLIHSKDKMFPFKGNLCHDAGFSRFKLTRLLKIQPVLARKKGILRLSKQKISWFMPNFSLIAYYNRKKRCPALSGKIGMNWRKERLFFQKRPFFSQNDWIIGLEMYANPRRLLFFG